MRTDFISETLAGLVALASRAHPAAGSAMPPTEGELVQGLSRWTSGAEDGELLSGALRHDRGFGGVQGRGFFRFFADSEQAVPLAPSFVVASRAAALERRGGQAAAELLYRISFASGEMDPRTDAAIERQTVSLFAPARGRPDGLSVQVSVQGRDIASSSFAIRDAAMARAFLEREMGSRITFSDLVGLLDIASPLIPLTGIELEVRHLEPLVYSMEAVGIYGGRRELWYSLDLGVTVGSPEIFFRNIRVDRRLQGLGIGARSVLALALFASRHGIEEWHETACDDGLDVWQRLGGEVMSERPILSGDDILWLRYRTERVLTALLDTYFPERILRAFMAGELSERTRGAEPRDRLLAQEGFREAYQQGLREVVVHQRLKQEQTAFPQREAAILMPGTTAVAAHPLQPLPLAPAALIAVGGMAFHPVR